MRTFVERQVHHVYLVQVMFDIVATPNVQMFVEPDTGAMWCVGASDQRVDQNLVHQGNVYPSNARTLAEMICSARKLARWLQTEGFTGLVGFDFVEYVHPTTRRLEHIFAEMNPRINGNVSGIFNRASERVAGQSLASTHRGFFIGQNHYKGNLFF